MKSHPRARRLGALSWIGAAALLALAARAPKPSADSLTVTFLGNEGFLLETRGRKVLIDALVDTSSPDNVRQSDELRAGLEGAEAPFDDVDLVLTTHVHADHFCPQAVGRHLTANPKARYVSTPQSVARLRAEFAGFAAIEERVRAIGPTDGGRERVEGLGLEVLAMHHGRELDPPIENDSFVLELGAWKLLHMGDSQCSRAELEAFDLDEAELDLAFVPSWYFGEAEWKGAIAATVETARSVVMHLAPDWSSAEETANQRHSRALVDRILAEQPDAIVFEAALQTRNFEPAADEER